MCTLLSPAKRKTTSKDGSGKKKSGNKKPGAKRVKEQQNIALRRLINSILGIVLLFVVLTGGYYVWTFLGRPGLNPPAGNESTACLELYFFDSSVAYLVPVMRRVTLAPGDSRTVKAVQEYAIGPKDPQLARVYPANIPIPVISIRGDVAVVDLPKEIRSHLGGTYREKSLLDSLALTVKAAGECSKVRLLIGGEIQEATPEGYEIDNPMEPPKNINMVPDSSIEGNSSWVTAYFLDASGNYLVPLSVQSDNESPPAEFAVNRMLDGPPPGAVPGIRRISPPGYELDKIAIENGAAEVNILIPNPQSAFPNSSIGIFQRALYLSLRDCCDITSLTLKINEKDVETYSRFANLPDVSDENCWNLEAGSENNAGEIMTSTAGGGE